MEEDTIESQARLENLGELVNAVAEYEQRDPAGGLRGFLEAVTLASSIDGFDSASGTLSLMTLHNAKGLEFPVIYIVGMVDGLLPHSRALYGEDLAQAEKDMEEERRLFYVGMTRAREELLLSWSKTRMFQGRREMSYRSTFLNEVPEDYLKVVGGGPSAVKRPERRAQRKQAAKPRSLDFGDSQIVYDVDADTGSYEQEGGATLVPGDRVFHPRFGEGVIKRFEESGVRQKVVVRFDGGATKKFSAKYAPLSPV